MAYLGPRSSVLAVITHYRYERWLAQSIASLCGQTRPPTAIVVVDDNSPEPPIDIVGRFPGVTLLQAERNGGPYLMQQAIFDRADYDAFMLQDADDWSSRDRLDVELRAAEDGRAEMVGCQMSNVCEGMPSAPQITVPLDPRLATLENPTVHCLTVATSIIARSLIHRVGGLATGLRFGADSEFTRRAIFAGRVLNVPDTCYFRRVHPQAATQAEGTGHGSPLRAAIRARVQERARSNVAQVLQGKPPNLEPLDKGEPARMRHLAGPGLRGL